MTIHSLLQLYYIKNSNTDMNELNNIINTSSPNAKGLEWMAGEVSKVLIAAVNDVSNLPPQ